MKRDHVNAVTPVAIGDYPAAHSMDTTWYAVDENGEIGKFLSGEGGDVPVLEGMVETKKVSAPVSIGNTEGIPFQSRFLPIEDAIQDAAWRRWPRSTANREEDQEYQTSEYNMEMTRDLMLPPLNFHIYEVPDRNDAYHWQASPRHPMTIRDLPEQLRNDYHLLFLKDFAFKSREPIDPFDYAPNCFTYGDTHLTPSGSRPAFPIPSRWNFWNGFDLAEADLAYGCDDAFFIAADVEDHLAVFQGNAQAAIPKSKIIESRYHLLPDDRAIWLDMVRAGLYPPGSPTVFTVHENLHLLSTEQAIEREERTRHWLEYPFHGNPPRLYGLYHYDMSWWHAGPYVRIGVPKRPVRLGEISPQWLEKLDPVRFADIRFAEAERIQPYQHAGSPPGTMELVSSAEVWIDEQLEHVHPCREDAIKYDDDERLLRRARRHDAMIEALYRKG